MLPSIRLSTIEEFKSNLLGSWKSDHYTLQFQLEDSHLVGKIEDSAGFREQFRFAPNLDNLEIEKKDGLTQLFTLESHWTWIDSTNPKWHRICWDIGHELTLSAFDADGKAVMASLSFKKFLAK